MQAPVMQAPVMEAPVIETPIRRNLRRAVAGLAVVLLVYAGLLATAVRGEEPVVEAGWTSSAAERLRPYGTVAAETGTAFVHDAAQLLTSILAFAPLPLAVLSLLWLARRDERVYLRLAVALLLSGTAGLGVFAEVRGVREASLFGDYLALPGVRVGWYVLMALAVVATTSKTWPRAAVLLLAVLAAVSGASNGGGGDLWLAALPAVVVPLLAWYVAGHLPDEKGEHARGDADASPAGESRGRVLSFQPRPWPLPQAWPRSLARARAPESTGTPGPAPLREAG
ncbi:hypothetical protein [Streptomyces deccanensis]|uniref:hypothetical protein n=1 Tax=Streptomyces deccanensis TaxID=424188 RepID=UPI001EFA6488|nr:hypothetical protein [Streptomyces deccanensis]ULR55705.1 hypothetical protein L3078_44015 [Streptomyces deccanensis]